MVSYIRNVAIGDFNFELHKSYIIFFHSQSTKNILFLSIKSQNKLCIWKETDSVNLKL